MTNELGRQLAAAWEHEEHSGDKFHGITLGAYRRAKFMPWCPGATIDVWTKCARQEMATGVPWPHAYFIQTLGGPDGGHIMCPQCRGELAKLRSQKTALGAPQKIVGQLSLF